MKQTIDISPDKVQPIAAAGIRFLNLETTLIPGNLKNQLAVLEVFLSGLAAGELLLAPPAPLPVESDVKTPDKGDGADEDEDMGTGPPKKLAGPMNPTEVAEIAKRMAAEEQTGAGEGQSG